MDLAAFRAALAPLLDQPTMRPFVCHGSPLNCGVFIVGFNPATALDKPFWSYWSDESGFDKPRFLADYLKKRELKNPIGVRARIERIAEQLPLGSLLETNICSLPTKRAVDLKREDRRTRVFEFLMRTIRPSFVYAHSDDPIRYFQERTGRSDFAQGAPRSVSIGDHLFQLIATSGPLFRMGFEDAAGLGRSIRAWTRAGA